VKKTIYIVSLVVFFSAVFFSLTLAATAIQIPATGLSNAGIKTILDNILKWILGILGVVGLIGFVISGMMYLASTGNDKTIEKAKKAMAASIIGIVIGLGGFIAVKAIDAILNAQKNF
jgi:hypothetical protein